MDGSPKALNGPQVSAILENWYSVASAVNVQAEIARSRNYEAGQSGHERLLMVRVHRGKLAN